MGLIIPKCNAHPKTLEIALGIYYDINDWVENSLLIDRLSQKLIEAQIEDRRKEPQSYTKKTQVLSYYGLLEWEDPSNAQSRRRITAEGRELYETLIDGNLEKRQELLLRLLASRTFGRNVVGCDSDSDLEAPNIFLKSCILIGNLTNKEFAYILSQMEFQKLDLADALSDLVVIRKKNITVQLDGRSSKWADPKPILALADWGLLTTESHGQSKVYNVNQDVLDKFTKQIVKLRIRNTFPNRIIAGLERATTSLQIIYFGTPGSGKSHKVQQSLEGVPEKCVFRTTFHPDSDYASFVGCYKPIVRQLLDRTALSKEELKAKLMEYKQTKDGQHPLHRFCAAHPEFANLSGDDKKEILASAGEPESKYVETYKAIACADELRKYMTDSDITYEFTPQVFTNAYVQAWKLQIEASEQAPAQAVYLVIEEINRGNCAQIFGDLFQLLDRNEEGFSTYKIRADKDLTMYLQKELGEGHEGIASGNLRLPANLHIIATMNTSDQSLFPMDSAFKRRWDWEYVPIDYGEEIASGKFEISIGDKKYRWIDFLKAVNKRILESTDSEDKQMGNFFIKQSVDEKVFKSKVMSYLWHEVCKDEYHTKNNFFRTNQEKEGEEFTFNELHEENGTNLLIGFMQYLGVKAQEDDPYQAGNSGTPNASEEGVES